jgi:outer membrane PBP1 activator LpoA protein
LAAAILYGCGPAFASEAPAQAAQVERAPVVAHIALLLPASSSAFARAGEAVKEGFLAAAKTQGSAPLPLRVYATADDAGHVVTAYREALAAGARFVVGPLTRSGVTALAASGLVTTPTLALNVPDRTEDLPADLYVLSLQVEAEARQVAQLAAREGRISAVTVVADTPLLRRIHQAFVEEFTRSGGRHVMEHAFTPDPAGLARIRQSAGPGVADMAFLALDFQRARLARPYLGALPVYATSQVHPGHGDSLAGVDLAGVRFLDMPWMVQPDHPAVMVYARPDYQDAADLQRLYALGIDAFRVTQSLLTSPGPVVLDGVTGRLTLSRGRQIISRELTAVRYADGRLLPIAGRQ